MNQLKRESVIAEFRKQKPKTKQEAFSIIKSCGIRTYYLAAGAFREVYKLGNVGLVLKVPIGPSDIHHGVKEMEISRRMKVSPKYKPLRQFVPDIFYGDKVSGIILMQLYDTPDTLEFSKIGNLIGMFTEAVLGDDCDVYHWNIGQLKNPNDSKYPVYKYIDLGLFK